MTTLPPYVVRALRSHLGMLAVFNAEVLNLRSLGAALGQPGRYECEYREAYESKAQADLDRLHEIEQLPAGQQLDWPAVYASLGYTVPTMEPWSPEALAWRTPA